MILVSGKYRDESRKMRFRFQFATHENCTMENTHKRLWVKMCKCWIWRHKVSKLYELVLAISRCRSFSDHGALLKELRSRAVCGTIDGASEQWNFLEISNILLGNLSIGLLTRGSVRDHEKKKPRSLEDQQTQFIKDHPWGKLCHRNLILLSIVARKKIGDRQDI